MKLGQKLPLAFVAALPTAIAGPACELLIIYSPRRKK